MAADVGKMLELLDIAKLSDLYQSSIRKMQPADLVRRLESEKVSTRGHMPELRARLLRLEARKLYPKIEVPWYPEDEVPKPDTIIIEVDSGKPFEFPQDTNPFRLKPKNRVQQAPKIKTCVYYKSDALKDARPSQKSVVNVKEEQSIEEMRNIYRQSKKNSRNRYVNVLNPQTASCEPDDIEDQSEWKKVIEGLGQRLLDNKNTEEIHDIIKFGLQNAEKRVENTNSVPKSNQVSEKSLENNQNSSVTEENPNVSYQTEVKTTNNKSLSSSSVAEKKLVLSKALVEAARTKTELAARVMEDIDNDSFEDIDYGDWMDDYME